MIKIDKNVPVPANGCGRKSIYPFREMKVGDSISVPKEKFHSARCNAYFFARRNKRKFVARASELRIWRVK